MLPSHVKAPITILLSLVTLPAFAADLGCKSNSALLGQCYMVQGTVTVDPGIGATFNRDDSKSRLIIRPAPGNTNALPKNVDSAFGNYRVVSVHGDYQVCPIPSQPPFERERFVCVNSASHLSFEYRSN